MALSPGDSIAGFRIISLLGQGGMGAVYLVHNEQLDRREAMKIIAVAGGVSEEFRQRFTNEARTAAALDHPNIITVHQYGIDDGKPWFTMSHVDGPDLAEAKLSPPEVAEVVTHVAEALDYAHENGVVHRDIKPANVLITRGSDGRLRRVVVLDFGIAKLASAAQLTATNAFIGTVAYSAPEVIAGSQATGASDQYSLACTAYRLLTGQAPFDNPSIAALMNMCLNQPPPPLSNQRPDLARLDPVFARALAKNPADRFATCRDFAAALTATLRSGPAGRSGPVPPPHAGQPGPLSGSNGQPPSANQPHPTAQAQPPWFGSQPVAGPPTHLPQAAVPQGVPGAAMSGPYAQAVSPAGQFAPLGVPPAQSGKSPLPWVLAIVGIVAVIGIATGLFFWLSGDSEEASAKKEITSAINGYVDNLNRGKWQQAADNLCEPGDFVAEMEEYGTATDPEDYLKISVREIAIDGDFGLAEARLSDPDYDETITIPVRKASGGWCLVVPESSLTQAETQKMEELEAKLDVPRSARRSY